MPADDETRVVLVKPGDLVLIGGFEITPQNAELVRDAFEALDLHAIVFAGDIEIGKLSVTELETALWMARQNEEDHSAD